MLRKSKVISAVGLKTSIVMVDDTEEWPYTTNTVLYKHIVNCQQIIIIFCFY